MYLVSWLIFVHIRHGEKTNMCMEHGCFPGETNLKYGLTYLFLQLQDIFRKTSLLECFWVG